MALPMQYEQLPTRPAQAERVARAGLSASLFQTSRLPAPERFAAWRESISVFLDAKLASDDMGENFNATVESYLIDGIMLARCAAGQQKFARPVQKFARDGIDHYMIQLFVRGGVDMQRGGQRIRSDAGRAVAFDCGDVLDSINSDFDVLSVFIPRHRLAPLLRRPDSLHGVCPDPESGAGRMLASFYLDLYLNAPWLAERDTRVMADTLITLVAQAMNNAAPRDLSLDDAAVAALLRARTYVRDHHGDAAMDEDRVAAATGLGRAEIERIFEPVGGLDAFVTEQRLRRAAGRLMEGGRRPISTLVSEAGFSGMDEFSSAFRQRFGCDPADVWKGSQPAGRGDRETLNPLCGDRTYEDWIVCLA